MSKNGSKLEFAFGRQNYILLFVGVLIVVFGFALMSGGGSDDPNEFKGEYSITDESIELLNDEFKIDEAIVQKLSQIKDQVFMEESGLMEQLKTTLGVQDYEANYFELRSATTIDADIFSSRRITVAPFIALLGYMFIIYAIMKKPNVIGRETKQAQA